MIGPLAAELLPAGIRTRFVPNVNGLSIHLLEAGFEQPGLPCVLLLHGFPELGYSWRKVMPAVAAAGYHVIAPDQRGYGRTTGWDRDYDGDLTGFRMMNLVRDMVGLVAALEYTSVSAVVGHDFGASVAAWCALLRPDIFRSLMLMSAPFSGPPSGSLSVGSQRPVSGGPERSIHQALAALDRPRKHYQWYYSTREANSDMWHCPQGVHDFLRAYFHFKSADWKTNAPVRLPNWTAVELARMPAYYIMDLKHDMAATVAMEMPSAASIVICPWLPDRELRVYSNEFARTGFQGGLQWYRCRTQGVGSAELEVFAGRSVDVKSIFVAGAQDWGVYQTPGAFERMQNTACTAMIECRLIDGAGHWVQQEQPELVTSALLTFLRE